MLNGNKKGDFGFTKIAEIILILTGLGLALYIGVGLVSASGGKAFDLFGAIPGIPEAPVTLKTGALQADARCMLSSDCSAGLACYKPGGGSGFGVCVKSLEQQQLVVSGLHVSGDTKGAGGERGNCYGKIANSDNFNHNGYVKGNLEGGSNEALLPPITKLLLPKGLWMAEVDRTYPIYTRTKGTAPVYGWNLVLYAFKQKPVAQDMKYVISSGSDPITYPHALTECGGYCAVMITQSDVYQINVTDSISNVAADGGMWLRGGFYDTDCSDNSGYNVIRFEKISEDINYVYNPPSAQTSTPSTEVPAT